MTRLGHGPRCRCGDCGIEATRRRIAQMECEMKLCDHWRDGRWVSGEAANEHIRNTARMPKAAAPPEKVWR